MEFYYQCADCGHQYEISADRMVCSVCAQHQNSEQPLRGILETVLKGNVAKTWQIPDLLPVSAKYFPSVPVGNTPLWEPLRLRQQLDRPRLFIKDDSLNPTGSFKDRASILVSAFAAYHKQDRIVLASTGNAGSSMAGIGAAAGQKIILFLPEAAPLAKFIQALQYGATVYRVKGNYDKAYDLSREYSMRYGGISRNTAYNPMTIEGKKTVSLEIFRQLGRVPDHVFVPVGDGCILAGVYKGFRDLKQLGLTQQIPQIIAVQSEKSNAVALAFANKGEFSKIKATSLADSLNVDIPRNGRLAVHCLLEYGGACVTVGEEDILKAQAMLSASAGMFAEPAGATAFAGYVAMRATIPRDSLAVVLTTGNGLKDIATAARGGVAPPDEAISSIDDIPRLEPGK